MPPQNTFFKKYLFLGVVLFFTFSVVMTSVAVFLFFDIKVSSNDLTLTVEQLSAQERSQIYSIVSTENRSRETLEKVESIHEQIASFSAHECSNSESPNLCYYHIGQIFESYDFCTKVAGVDLRDQCLAKLAEKNLEKGICSSITNPNDQQTCIAVTTNNVGLCSEIISEYDKLMCVYAVASANHNPELCSSLNINDYNSSICYTKVARESNDPSVCKKMCSEQVAGSQNNHIADCSTAKTTWQSECYMQVGIVSQNMETCLNVVDYDKRQYCIALATQDYSRCPSISDPSLKYNCTAFEKTPKPIDYSSFFSP